MLIAHSTFSCALAYEGNRLRETLRLKTVNISAFSEDGGTPPDSEGASLSVCKLDSASLRQSVVVKLPKKLKPAIDREEMSRHTYRTIRGGWRRRVSKERRGTPGDPFQCLVKRVLTEQRAMGNHNHCLCWQRESERSIVAMKWGNSHRAKRPYFNHVSIEERGTA